MRLAALLLCASSLFGAVTLDNYQVGADNNGGGSLSWTHTTACSANCMGYVLASSLSSPSVTLTWGGVAMTLVTSQARTYGVNGGGTLYIYCIVGPSNGATTIAGSAAGAWLIGDSVTFSGAKQSCTADATAFVEAAMGTSPCPFVGGVGDECPITITPASANAYVLVMFSSTVSMIVTPTATGVYRITTDQYTDFFVWDANGTVNGTYTLSGGTSAEPSYSAMALSIAPVPSPVGPKHRVSHQ